MTKRLCDQDQYIEWRHDQDQYTKWCLDVRNLMIVAEDMLAAAKECELGSVVDTKVPDNPRILAEAMQVAARGLRNIADGLEQAVETGFADWDCRPIANGPKRPPVPARRRHASGGSEG